MCNCEKERIYTYESMPKADTVLKWINWNLVRVPLENDDETTNNASN